MKFLLLLTSLSALFSFNTARAMVCKGSMAEAKKLEKIVKDVYFISEADDQWTAFSSNSPVVEINESKIREVLNYTEAADEDDAFFYKDDYSRVYDFLRSEIQSLSYENDPEKTKEANKYRKLISTISKKYGKNVRFIEIGNGNGDSYFSGYYVILIIKDNGCILGLKAYVVQT